MMVALIVVATFTGFTVANRTTAEERQHDEAAVLAAQSQEQLRSDNASALEKIRASPYTYTQTVGGTVYSIKQEVGFASGAESSTECSVTEPTRQAGNALRVASTVTWQHQKLKPVTEASVITPPTGAALEVDVGNDPSPTAGVPGVTATVKYTPIGTETPLTLEGTTSSAGCLLFGALSATSAIVEIAEKTGYVTPTGALKFLPEEVTLAPNITTHHPVTFNLGGAITAAFAYEGNTTYTHKTNSAATELTEPVKGDTFLTYNQEMNIEPYFEVGSPTGTFSSGIYGPKPGGYASRVTTPKEPAKYPNGNLFPFGKSESEWLVYAGDCTKNDPHTVNSALEHGHGVVEPGLTTTITVPMSHVQLNAYNAKKLQVEEATTEAWKKLEASKPLAVTITNVKCVGGPTPNNETALSYKHTQHTTNVVEEPTTGTANENGGHLQAPFQPFGEFELCMYDEAANKRTYKVTYENREPKGPPPLNVYLLQRSPREFSKARVTAETEETAAKTAREASENTTKTTRETTEAAARATRIAEETAAKTTWEKEKKRTAKEKKTREEAEKGPRKLAEEAEATKKTAAENAETTARNAAVATEVAKKAARVKREGEEETAEKASGIAVESETAGCP